VIETIPPAAWAAMTAAVGAVAGWWTTRGKNEADIAAVHAETSITLLHEMRDENKRLRERLESVEAEVVDCEERYDRVEIQYNKVIRYLRDQGCDVTQFD
jgi:hypothetical protein